MQIKELIQLHNAYEKEVDKISSIFPNAFESNLIELTYKMFDALLEYVAEEHNINSENLAWFIFDNEQGKNGFEINDIPIKSLTDFLLIEKGKKVVLKDGTTCYFNLFEEENTTYIVFLPETLKEPQIKELNEIAGYFRKLDF